MKKNYLTMLFALLVMFFTGAKLSASNGIESDNIMSISSVVGQPGETVQMALSLDNVDAVVAIQVDVVLNNQMTYIPGSIALTDRATANHHIVANMQSSGNLRILIYSIPGTVFNGNSGPLCTFNLTLGQEPGVYPISLTGALLSDWQGHGFDVTTVDGTVTIQGAQQNYTITANANPTNAGTITGAGTYVEGSTATLVATPNSGYIFSSWTENETVVSSDATYSFTVTGDRNLVANFTSSSTNIMYLPNLIGDPGQTLQVGLSLDNVDAVVAIQVDIMLNDQMTYVPGSIALTDRATANHHIVANMQSSGALRILIYSIPGTVFNGNSGPLCTFNLQLGQTPGTYPLTMSGALLSDWQGHGFDVTTVDGSITINGGTQSYTIIATANPVAGGTITGAGTYDQGATATLVATANSGYTFTNWTENGTVVSTDATYSFTVTGDRTLVANFTENVVNYIITATANPVAGGTITGAGTYAQGTTATLVATANSGYTFANWTENGTVVSTDATYSFTVTGNRTLVANFTENVVNYTITATANPVAGGTITGAGTYAQGTTATLVATANTGYTFANWTENDAVVSTDAAYSFTVTGDRTLVANFTVNSGNVLVMSSVTGEAGSTVTMSVSLNNSDPVAAFQFDVPLSSAFSYVDGSVALTSRATSNHQIVAGIVNGALRIIVYSMPPANFTGNEGPVCTFNLLLGQTAGTYPIEITNAILSDTQGGSVTVSSVVNGTVTITPAVTGNTLSIDNITGNAGDTKTMTISLDNNDEVVGFQVDVMLPSQVSFVSGSVTLSDRATANHNLVYNIIPSGALRILVYSMPSTPFTGDNGPLCTFNVTLGNEAGTYPVTLSEAVLSDINGNELPVTTTDGSITINGGTQNYTITATANPVAGGTITGAGTYAQGSTATLVATANSGYTFANWTENGTVVSTSATYSFTVTGDRILVANFTENVVNYTITTTANPVAGGTITGAGTYAQGTTATLVATANSGYTFANWTENGTVVSTDAAYSFTVTGNRTLVANFTVNSGNVLVMSSAIGETGSTVTMSVSLNNSDPVAAFQMDIPLNSELSYVSGSIALTGRATSSHQIAADIVNGALRIIVYSLPPANFTGNEGPVCTFNLQLGQTAGTYPVEITNAVLSDGAGNQVTLSSVVNGTVIITPAVTGNNLSINNITGNAGETKTMTISLANADEVVGFQVDVMLPSQVSFVSGSVALSDRATANHNLVYNIIPSGALRILVYSMPSTPFTGDDGPLCTFNVTLGNEAGTYPVTLSEAVLSDINGNELPVTTTDGSITINGGTQNYTITATANPVAGGTITGAGTYAQGSTATLVATANSGYTFANWTENGTIVSTSAIYSFTVTTDRTLVANFTTIPTGNVLSLDNITGNPGDVKTITLSMDNVDEVVGFQVDIMLPSQVSLVSGSVALTSRATANHNLAYNFIPSGALRILVYSMPGTPFNGNNGALCTFQVTLGNGQGTYPVTLSEAVLSDIQGNELQVSTIDGSVTINGQLQNYTITATANPTDGGTITGAGTYQEGTTATLVATANSGYLFSNWTENGTVVSTNASYSFTVTGNRTLVANFSTVSGNVFTLDNVSGNAGDIVTLTLSLNNVDPVAGFQIDVVLPSQATFVPGSVTLTSRATASHNLAYNFIPSGALRILVYSMPSTAFNGNSGALCTLQVTLGQLSGTYNVGLENPVISDLQGNELPIEAYGGTITINGGVPSYAITATANPVAGGTITGAGQYAEGATATLTATANSGYVFANWTENGTVVSSNTVYSFTVTRNRTLVANFTVQPKYTITATANPTAGGTVTGAGTYDYGVLATLTANSNDGYEFTNWTENNAVVSTSSIYSFTVTRNRTLVAHFKLQTYTITTVANPIVGGTVTGSGVYTFNYSLTVTATASTGYTFKNWTENGTVVSTNASYTFNVQFSRLLIANFQINSYTISASADPAAYGTVAGAGSYDYGETAVLTATPTTGNKFVSWTENGAVVSNYSSFEFIVTSSRTLVAHFEPIVGIEDVTAEDISVYPNPSTDNIRIDCPAMMTKLVVVNINGMIVRSFENIDNTNCTIDVRDLSNGTYFVKIIAPNGCITKKFVKM